MNFFTSVGAPGTIRHDFPHWVGCQFQAGPHDLWVSELGRWIVPSSQGQGMAVTGIAHELQIWDSSFTVIADVVLAAGQAGGAFAYQPLPNRVRLTAGATYYIFSLEDTDDWYNNDFLFTTSTDATVQGSVYSVAGAGNVPAKTADGLVAYVPPNFIYSVEYDFIPVNPTSTSRTDGPFLVGCQFQAGVTPTSIYPLSDPPAHSVYADQLNSVCTNFFVIAPVNAVGMRVLKDASDTATSRTMGIWDIETKTLLAEATSGLVTYTLYASSDGPTTLATGATPYVVGSELQASIPGQITAIRFFKSTADTSSTHTGAIWTADGSTKLAEAVSSGETASGWQQINLPTPLTISANTTYVVSVLYPASYIWYTARAAPITSGVLRAPQYRFFQSATSVFPANTQTANCYFTDVVFLDTTSVAEPASGWLEVMFPTPIALTPNYPYQAGVFNPSGVYVYTYTYFAQAHVSGILNAYQAGNVPVIQWNGSYDYGPAFQFGTSQPGNNATFWIDVILEDIPGHDLLVDALGRWIPTDIAVVGQAHAVFLMALDGTVLGEVSIDTTGQTAGTFVFASLPSPVRLTKGAKYWLMSAEPGGDPWYSVIPVSTSPDVMLICAAYANGIAATLPTGYVADQTYGPPNFRYAIAPSDIVPPAQAQSPLIMIPN